jgi:hypothetical protein
MKRRRQTRDNSWLAVLFATAMGGMPKAAGKALRPLRNMLRGRPKLEAPLICPVHEAPPLKRRPWKARYTCGCLYKHAHLTEQSFLVNPQSAIRNPQ